MAVMAGPWSLDRLAVAAGETETRLRWCVDVGLLHRQANGDFEPDCLHRMRLIQFARTRGVGDEQLAAATASQAQKEFRSYQVLVAVPVRSLRATTHEDSMWILAKQGI
jgi:hypothetical protein